MVGRGDHANEFGSFCRVSPSRFPCAVRPCARFTSIDFRVTRFFDESRRVAWSRSLPLTTRAPDCVSISLVIILSFHTVLSRYFHLSTLCKTIFPPLRNIDVARRNRSKLFHRRSAPSRKLFFSTGIQTVEVVEETVGVSLIIDDTRVSLEAWKLSLIGNGTINYFHYSHIVYCINPAVGIGWEISGTCLARFNRYIHVVSSVLCSLQFFWN